MASRKLQKAALVTREAYQALLELKQLVLMETAVRELLEELKHARCGLTSLPPHPCSSLRRDAQHVQHVCEHDEVSYSVLV